MSAMVDLARRLHARDGWALVECCERCGRDEPDGLHETGRCRACRRRKELRPPILDREGARLQRMVSRGRRAV